MDELKLLLKQQLIKALNLEGMTPDDIDDAAPLFGEGLGLDSIDALEIIILLDRNYGVKFADKNDAKAVFASINALAAYVSEHRQK